MAPSNPMPKTNSTNTKKKKKKKKTKSGPDSVAMKLKAPKPNPFESLCSRRKFDILGKKRKGEERRIGLARSVAIAKRKKTLLKEYEQSTKSSVFVDKRIGEQNEELEEFDKAILRSQRERQLKLKKKSKYNLSDGEEDEFGTQDGLSFAERDDFEEEIAFDEDEDGKEIGNDEKAAILGQLNEDGVQDGPPTGFMEGQEERQRSKKEIMEEIIMKSKFFKAQKAKDKEENEQLIEQLDKDFSSMVQCEALLSLTQPSKMNALKALVNKSFSTNIPEKDDVAVGQAEASSKQEKPDSYDKLVSEMVLDMRARPSDRTKTPEEIAQEEKERLEQLEEERKKRMAAADVSSDEDGDASEDDHLRTKRVQSVSGDDLGDSFSKDEVQRKKKRWIDLILQKKSEESKGEDTDSSEDTEGDEDDGEEEGAETDDEESGKSESLKDWEQSDDDNSDTNLEEEEDDDEEEEDGYDEVDEEEDGIGAGIEMDDNGHIEALETKLSNNKKVKASGKQHSSPDELPYTIEAPKSLEEFMSLVENRSNDQIVEAVRRIRAFNAINVAAENRKKMQVFYGVLLQYFAVLANKKPLNFKLLNMLVKPLMEMSTEIPYFAAICARQRLQRIRTQFCDDLKNTGKSCWPSLKTLFLLRLWSMIFPCSDFRHAVMTPAILLMCEYLMRCPIKSGRDIAVGSFLCSMVLFVSKQSKKFCPEAIIFIRTLLAAAFDKKKGQSQDSQLYHLMEIKSLESLLCINGSVKEIKSLDFLMLMESPEDSPHFSSDSFRASVLLAIIDTLQGFISIYERLNSFPEIFLPISRILNELEDQNHMPAALKSRIREAAQLIDVKADEHHRLRKPLQMRKQKIVPIKLLNPKFEENFVKGRDYDPDRERAERRKLKKLLKQEAKGAQRELKKDNYFLYEVKQRDKALLEEERAEKYGKARAFLQEQEHAFKSGQLGKNRKRRR